MESYWLEGSSLDPYINGRYFQNGVREGLPVFLNVRKWAIFRTSLKEIPELDIYAHTCYMVNTERSNIAVINEKAGNVFDLSLKYIFHSCYSPVYCLNSFRQRL